MLCAVTARRLARACLPVTLAVTLLSITAVTAGAAEDTVRWKVPVGFASTLPALGDTAPWVFDRLEKASDGRVILKLYEPGKLVPALQIMEAVKEGKVQAGYTWIGYDMDKIPAVPLLAAVPFGFEPWEYNAWWYYGGGHELAEELYAPNNIYPILCGIIGPETAGWFRNEIVSLDDLKGLKIRFAGLGGRVMQKLGASVTLLPAGEIFQALEKGSIDATEFSLPEVDQKLGFAQVAKYNYFPGWHQPFTTMHVLVNKDVWKDTSEANQALIELGCQAGVTAGLAKSEANQGAIVAGFADIGVTAKKLPEPILRELQKVSEEVMEEEAANDAMFAKIWESQKAFKKNYQIWKDFGYLPRDF